MAPDSFRAWRKRHGWTQAEAAAQLGLGKRVVELYEAGWRNDTNTAVEIPKTVALACAALDAELAPLP